MLLRFFVARGTFANGSRVLHSMMAFMVTRRHRRFFFDPLMRSLVNFGQRSTHCGSTVHRKEQGGQQIAGSRAACPKLASISQCCDLLQLSVYIEQTRQWGTSLATVDQCVNCSNCFEFNAAAQSRHAENMRPCGAAQPLAPGRTFMHKPTTWFQLPNHRYLVKEAAVESTRTF